MPPKNFLQYYAKTHALGAVKELLTKQKKHEETEDETEDESEDEENTNLVGLSFSLVT